MDSGEAGRPQLARLSRLSLEKKYSSENSGWVAASLLKTYNWNSSYPPLMDFSVPLPRAQFVNVPHVQQLCNWDCGLACVLMVLNTLGIQGHDIKSLGQLCCTSSIWTVDLAHLLRLFGVDVVFLTVTIGANPSFAVETFYKENMEEDGERVNKLFEKAPLVGIQVQWRSFSSQELAMIILSGRYLAIALLDKRKLSYPWLEELCLSDCCGIISEYTGHYVVICGYDMDTDEFEIRDPASSSEHVKISSNSLDEARKSFGTDEDILVVSLDSNDKDTATNLAVSLRPS